MRIQTLTGIFPTERPPDPENGSPGAVGTVTGAEVQSPEIISHASPTTPVRPAAPLRIVIEPTASGRKWTARLGDPVLCVTAWPFVKSARLLLAEGYPAAAVIEMWRPNTADWALRGRLGAVAATVIDGETASRGAKNGSPARDRRFVLVLGSFLGVDDDARKQNSTPELASPAANRRSPPHRLRRAASRRLRCATQRRVPCLRCSRLARRRVQEPARGAASNSYREVVVSAMKIDAGTGPNWGSCE